MTTETCFRVDVLAVLTAVAVQAVSTYAADGRHNSAYLQGALDAARAVALGCQVSWPDALATIRANLAPSHQDALDAAAGMLPPSAPALVDGVQ